MSGGNVSYNLRPNKFVERQLFVELLSIFYPGVSNKQVVYVSMGGPQLEDLRLVHHRLGCQNLISLEADEAVFKRQQFNLRPSYVRCVQSTVSDFVDNYDNFYSEFIDHSKVLWFDYAAPRERLQQLTEYETILGQLEDGDILKITLNANPKTLGVERNNESPQEIQNIRKTELIRQLGSLISEEIKPEHVTKNNLPKVLAGVIRTSSIRALENYKGFTAMPLGLFAYQDGPHQMLTATVRVTARDDIDSIREKLERGGWEYLPPLSNWQDVSRIDVPNLSAQERLHLEQNLFKGTCEEVHADLPFQLHPKEKISLQMLEEYARHYRRYPSFFQVIL